MLLWNMKPEDAEELLTRKLADDPEFKAADRQTRNKMVEELVKSLNVGKMALAAMRGPAGGADWKQNRLIRNGQAGVYDVQTGELTTRPVVQVWNQMSGQVRDIDPVTGQSVAPGRYKLVTPRFVEQVKGFEDTVNQGRTVLGGLASQWQRGAKIAKVWDTQFGAFIRRYTEGPEKEQFALQAEQGLVETAALNAALMHSRAQIGYRPPEALYMSLKEHITSAPMGSYQAKVRSMAAFVILTELSARAKKAEVTGEDVNKWGLASPLTAARIGQAINRYAAEVEAGRNPNLPSFEDIMGLPPLGTGATMEDHKADEFETKASAFGLGQ
jgi:hypothetical protein